LERNWLVVFVLKVCFFAAQYKMVFPGFFGRKAVTAADGTVSHYLVLEDLTSGLKKANIMDLKIGFRGHDDQARGMKIVQQV
jgi:hypothetical protein